MELNQYQARALETAVYPVPVMYPALKLNGEAGEVAEKVGKLMRDKGALVVDGDKVRFKASDEDREAIAKELGDVLWYIAALAVDLGYSLDAVARMNLEKLASRQARGVINGSGDNR